MTAQPDPAPTRRPTVRFSELSPARQAVVDQNFALANAVLDRLVEQAGEHRAAHDHPPASALAQSHPAYCLGRRFTRDMVGLEVGDIELLLMAAVARLLEKAG